MKEIKTIVIKIEGSGIAWAGFWIGLGIAAAAAGGISLK